jgi:hypothetical protein
MHTKDELESKLDVGIDLDDPHRQAQMHHRGLDLTNVEETSEQEKLEFKLHHLAQFGYSHEGLNFWLEHDPAVLKRHRIWCALNIPKEGLSHVWGHGYLTFYPRSGYVEGTRYSGLWQAKNKQRILEQIAIGFIHCGAMGMDTIAKAMRGLEWPEVDEPLEYIPPYLPDPDAFKSGIDFSDPVLTSEEYEKIKAWYIKYLGELPGYVEMLWKYRPALLKAHRNRIENMLKVSPKQVMPLSLLHWHIIDGHGPGIREMVLWSRGFGVFREDLWAVIGSALVYAGPEGASLVHEVVGEEIDNWPEELLP